MTLVLSLETATRAGSLAVLRGSETLARKTGDAAVSHSIHLLGDVDECLKAARVRLDEIELFVAVTGPGSFTGLRTGLATVKGFAATLERGVVGVPTLEAIARIERGRGRASVMSLLPAGRGEMFAQMLAVRSESEIVELEPPSHLTPEAVLEKALAAKTRLRWAGEGARVIAAQIGAMAESAGLTFADEAINKDMAQSADWTLAAKPTGEETLAEHAAALGLARFRAGRAVSPAELKALYVRLSDAELKEKCHR